jgi:hypothetical protein
MPERVEILPVPEDGTLAKSAENAVGKVLCASAKSKESTIFEKEVPSTTVPIIWAVFDEDENHLASFRVSPNAKTMETGGRMQYVPALMEIWKEVEDTRRELCNVVVEGYPVLVEDNSSLHHMGESARVYLAWVQDEDQSDVIAGMEGISWPRNAVYQVASKVYILLKEDHQDNGFAHKDPLWRQHFGCELPCEQQDIHPIEYNINQKMVSKFLGGEIAYRAHIDEKIGVQQLWREVCSVSGYSDKLLVPPTISLYPEEGGIHGEKGVINHRVWGYTIIADPSERPMLGSSMRTSHNIVNIAATKEERISRPFFSHELHHYMMPCCPDNEILIEGMANLSVAIQKRDFNHNDWISIQNLDGFVDLLNERNYGYNLGDSVTLGRGCSLYRLIHNCASAQALWEVLGKNEKNYQILASLMRSPVLDISTTDAFTQEVDKYIPGFHMRFWSHPTMQKAKSGPRLTALVQDGGFLIYGTNFQYNEHAGLAANQDFSMPELSYIWKREDVNKFDRSHGTEEPMMFETTIINPGGTQGANLWQIQHRCEEDGMQAINFPVISRWADEQGIPRDKLAGNIHICFQYNCDGKTYPATKELEMNIMNIRRNS